jgi:hypothetical protein
MYCRITVRTGAGVSGFAKMRVIVLVCRRPSLCFDLTIVQAVLRLRPSAFACSSNLV